MRILKQLESISGGHEYDCILSPLQQAVSEGRYFKTELSQEWSGKPISFSSLDPSKIISLALCPNPFTADRAITISYYDCNSNSVLYHHKMVQPNASVQWSSDSHTATLVQSGG